HNLVVDYFRNNKKMPVKRDTDEYSVFSIMTDDSPNIERQLIDFQIEKDLKKVINELPEDQKEVLMMRIYQDLSFKEISELTGVCINTAFGSMRYLILNLRSIIEKKKIILTH